MRQKKISLGEFKTILPYLKKYRVQYTLGFLCLLVVDAAQAVIPQFIRGAVDLITQGDFRWFSVFRYCAAMLAAMLFVASGRFLWRRFIHGSSRRIEAELREDLFAHLLAMSYDFYQKNKIGDLMARAINDIGAVQNSLGWGLVTLVDGTIMASSILVIIFIQDSGTAAMAVLPLPFVTAAILLFGRAMGKLFHRAQETYSVMSDTVQETFAGIRVIKSFVKEWWFIKRFGKTNDDYRDANMSLVRLYGGFFPFVSFLAGLTTLILLLAGGRRVVLGYLSPGSLVALFSYLQMLIWPLMGAGFMVNMIQRGAAGMARINDIFRTEPGIQNVPGASGVPPRSGAESDPPAIDIRNLSFAYVSESGARPVLENITVSVPGGTSLGILGRTGSGKSTLLKTFVRMVDPPEGSVFVRGVDVRLWDMSALRGLFGVSPQDSYLFSDTIKNNIGYGMNQVSGPEAPAGAEAPGGNRAAAETREGSALVKAAELAALSRDMESFAAGWETLIGERGLTLSGGQKQRVAIARALLSRPGILVLDDSFSAVDAETERRILDGILGGRKAEGKTTIIVSHKVSTLSAADRVVVLESGKITEYGTPAELLSGGEFFARMAELQRLGESGAGESRG
ncbi:MAG: ABC transporter ATP-binding protein/permease [Treponema sp.]|jgi:ATP-binding cassette subfamily B protein|nr:ABC transporter ATP-binding protein/permease [Treponema sp.]